MFHHFPYKAKIPVRVNGKIEERLFTSKEDVDEVIKLLIKEIEEFNEEGKGFDVGLSVFRQLHHFSCINSIYSHDFQKDIQKYIYCKEFSISPYPGSHNEHPKRWVDKMFHIKRAFAKKEESMINKKREELKNG
jgi:hypothetical protein